MLSSFIEHGSDNASRELPAELLKEPLTPEEAQRRNIVLSTLPELTHDKNIEEPWEKVVSYIENSDAIHEAIFMNEISKMISTRFLPITWPEGTRRNIPSELRTIDWYAAETGDIVIDRETATVAYMLTIYLKELENKGLAQLTYCSEGFY